MTQAEGHKVGKARPGKEFGFTLQVGQGSGVLCALKFSPLQPCGA